MRQPLETAEILTTCPTAGKPLRLGTSRHRAIPAEVSSHLRLADVRTRRADPSDCDHEAVGRDWEVRERRGQHHFPDAVFSDVAAGALNTALQAGLRLDFLAFMQAMMPSTFGISEAHSRNTSGVQAARCSEVPSA